MNSLPLVSDWIGVVISAFRPHEHTGVQLAPKAVSTLIRNLRTIQELALETEQELQIHMELRNLASTQSEVRTQRSTDRTGNTGGANVVRLPTRLRTIATPSDGGDAA